MACLIHLRFVSIHPFGNGNGRMTILLMNYFLYKIQYPMFDIPADIKMPYFYVFGKIKVKNDEVFFVNFFLIFFQIY